MNNQYFPELNDIESAVIGALLINNKQLPSVLQVIDAGDFYNNHNKTIFTTMKEMHRSDTTFDLITLPAYLNKTGLSNSTEGEIIAYLGEIAHKTPSAKNVLHYAKIIKKKSN